MKISRCIIASFFTVLFTFFTQAQELTSNNFEDEDYTRIENTSSVTKQAVKHRTFTNLKNEASGFYLIANVYRDKKNLKRFIKDSKKSGFANAQAIENDETGLNYASLEKFDNWAAAENAAQTKLNGAYNSNLWVMVVDNGNGNILKAPVTGSTELNTDINSSEENTILGKSVSSTSFNAKSSALGNNPNYKTLQKADDYFDKMWYAEAAELYEQAINKSPKSQTLEVLQRVGDAHYFNTNMEKAYYWYDILFEKYRNDLSSESLFKYAHSLKGTGKYGRAKKLMRLYNKKMAETGGRHTVDAKQAIANETVLDNILGMEPSFDVKNLKINSEYSDFSPTYQDKETVVFASAMDSAFFHTRRYKWSEEPYLDLYAAKINEETQELREATKLTKKINTKYHEAAVTFSPDNETMYFTRNNYGKKLKRDNQGVNHLKIYMSKKVDGEWSEAVELPFNSDNYSTGHPALSPDGKKLYFVSDMPGSIGKTDIFVVDILGEGQFSDPKNLGPQINTEAREMFPFVNNEKIYFSSDGHVGLGGLDVFEAKYLEEGEGFEQAENLGMPINSENDDFSYIIDEENQKGFFASNRKGGKGKDDLYSFKKILPEEPDANAIAGVVMDLVTEDIMPKALVELLDENNIKIKEMETADDGSFIFEDLEADKKYVLRVTKPEYFEETQSVTTIANDTVSVDFRMRRLKEMIAVEDGIKKLKTDIIHFDFDKSYIRPDAANELDKLVEVMDEYPDMVIKIESHTDSRGSREYNKYLSDRRAKSTRDYIISQGIDPSRIESAIGYGEEQLLNECSDGVRCSREQHEMNRRSEFIIVKM